MKLLEVVVAAGIAFVLAWALVRVAHDAVFTAVHLDTRLRAHDATQRLAERMESDAASAWSLFIPAADVLGASNADGHELDFVTEDASHDTYWWAYRYDPAAQRVTDYAYAPGGATRAGDVFDGITAFGAESDPVTDVALPASPAYDPLLASAGATPVDFDYGFARPEALGGNRLTLVHLTAAGVNRTLRLATNTAPTHFTVVVKYTPAP